MKFELGVCQVSEFHEPRFRLRYWFLVLLLCGGPLMATAQVTPSTQGASSTGTAPADAPSASVDAVGPRPSWLITPLISVEETYTNNVNLAAVKKSDLITRLSPGILLDGKGGRVSGNLNYQWQRYMYAQSSGRSNQQRSLAAKGQAELVDEWLFVDASHNISQQTVSAFGTQSSGTELLNSNRSETAGYSLSPYIKGRFASLVDYQLRYSGTRTRSDSGALSGGTATTTRAWNGQVAGATPLALLGWSLTADSQVVSHSTGAESRSNRMSGTLTYQVDPQIKASISAGNESENYTSSAKQKRTTSGVGLNWAPTERTSLALKRERNSAGNGYNVDFSHRTALSAWKFSDSRVVTIPTPQMALARTGTAYDLIYQQLASSFPD